MSGQSFYKLGVITYFNLNRKFIAEVLCINKAKPTTTCHGQCFLKKNLDLESEAPKSTAPVGKEKIDISIFLPLENYYSFYGIAQLPAKNTRYYLNYSVVNPDVPFRPPTAG